MAQKKKAAPKARPPEKLPPEIKALIDPYLTTMREAEAHVNEILSAYSPEYRKQEAVYKQGMLIYAE